MRCWASSPGPNRSDSVRMNATPRYTYTSSVKSDISDEWINTYLLRPLAGLLVRLLYRTPVTPNQVTLAAIAAGLLAAFLYAIGSPALTAAAGLCITLKDILDSADGQLARAKELYSRAGRFLDSIGDFAVNLLVFAAIASTHYRTHAGPLAFLLAAGGFLGISLRVSYHVFYQTSYLHLQKAYLTNRTTEELRDEDRHADATTRRLQVVFGILYGWQDTLMVWLDGWSRCWREENKSWDRQWYGDTMALRLSGTLGLGTELFLLMLCSVTDSLQLYFWLNICMMNAVWGASIAYRRYLLFPRLQRERG